MTDQDVDPRMGPAIDLIGHTGADSFKVGHAWGDDADSPTVWIAAARWGVAWECAAAFDPMRAVFRLAEQVIDGGMCTHCLRPSGVTFDFEPMPLPEHVCWYQWDPELQTFRRSCE